MRALWLYSQQEIGAIAPNEKFPALVCLTKRTFSEDKNPIEIANRFYAMMVCLDASKEDLDKNNLGIYGDCKAGIPKEVIEKLWDYFGDRSRTVNPSNIVRASEII